jgi:hypothetical protein
MEPVGKPERVTGCRKLRALELGYARWVRFDVESNFNGGNSVQLSEVRFLTANATVPLAATWMNAALGLALMGALNLTWLAGLRPQRTI